MVDMAVDQVEFLWKAMSVIPQVNDSSYILKCHLMSMCRSLHNKGDVHLPAKYIQKSSMCQFCSNFWKNGKYSLRISPEKIPPKSVKKILARYNKNPDSLRKFEIGLAKKYAQRKNTLIIKCGVCHKDTKIDMIKPERRKPVTEEQPKEPQLTRRKKKKKWTRDPTAGLKIPTSLQAQTNSVNDSKKQMLDVSNGHIPAKSEFSVWKKIENVNDKESVSSEGMGVTKVNSKKRKRQSKDSDPPVESSKRFSRLKIERKPEVSPKDNKLMKLVKNNKLGNMLANSKNVSESPLSKFLSSL